MKYKRLKIMVNKSRVYHDNQCLIINRHLYLVILCIGLLFLIGCSSTNVETISIEKIIEEKYQKTKTYHFDQETFNRDVTRHLTINDYQFSDDELKRIMTPRHEKYLYMTREEAMEDIDCFFEYLKHAYGGYGYYGGDQKFHSAKEKIISDVIEKQIISTYDLEKSYINHLSFISDGGFNIEGHHVNQSADKSFFTNQRYDIIKNEEKYYFSAPIKGEIVGINGEKNIDQFLKLSLDDEGNFIYHFGLLESSYLKDISLSVEYFDEKQKRVEEIFLYKVRPKNNQNQRAFFERHVNNIKVLECKSFVDRKNDVYLKDFVNSGLNISNSNVTIIDMRGNTGGSLYWSELWFENYLGRTPLVDKVCFTRISEPYIYSKMNQLQSNDRIDQRIYEMPNLIDKIDASHIKIQQAFHLASDKQWYIEATENEKDLIDHENLLIVLIDKNVGVEAEVFLMQLKRLNNIILIGSNTKGAYAGIETLTFYLPNSKTRVSFGASFNVFKEEGYVFEGKGVEPDIWLDNEGLLERVIKMCENK